MNSVLNRPVVDFDHLGSNVAFMTRSMPEAPFVEDPMRRTHYDAFTVFPPYFNDEDFEKKSKQAPVVPVLDLRQLQAGAPPSASHWSGANTDRPTSSLPGSEGPRSQRLKHLIHACEAQLSQRQVDSKARSVNSLGLSGPVAQDNYAPFRNTHTAQTSAAPHLTQEPGYSSLLSDAKHRNRHKTTLHATERPVTFPQHSPAVTPRAADTPRGPTPPSHASTSRVPSGRSIRHSFPGPPTHPPSTQPPPTPPTPPEAGGGVRSGTAEKEGPEAEGQAGGGTPPPTPPMYRGLYGSQAWPGDITWRTLPPRGGGSRPTTRGTSRGSLGLERDSMELIQPPPLGPGLNASFLITTPRECSSTLLTGTDPGVGPGSYPCAPPSTAGSNTTTRLGGAVRVSRAGRPLSSFEWCRPRTKSFPQPMGTAILGGVAQLDEDRKAWNRKVVGGKFLRKARTTLTRPTTTPGPGQYNQKENWTRNQSQTAKPVLTGGFPCVGTKVIFGERRYGEEYLTSVQ